jgi:chemotaxis protein CheC
MLERRTAHYADLTWRHSCIARVIWDDCCTRKTMDLPVDNLSEIQIDTIREISSIGMGNAATALSQMVDQLVKITVPKAEIVDIADVAKGLGGEELPVAAAYVQVVGEARGHLVLIFPTDDVAKLINLIAPGADTDVLKDEMARSAVQEIGNILASSFLRSLAEMTQLNMLPTVPAVAVDYAGSIITYVVASMYEITERLLLVRTEFDIGGERISGDCVFVPEPGSLRIILNSLGVGG